MGQPSQDAQNGACRQADDCRGGDNEAAVAAPVTVLFFAGARQAAGRAKESYPAGPGGPGETVEQLTRYLRRVYGPDMAAVLPTCAIWVNGLPAKARTVLRAGDEVAVLPPVSGGATAGPAPLPAPSERTERSYHDRGRRTAVASSVMPADPSDQHPALVDLTNLAEMPLAELRERREKCAESEMELSYVRRLAQARIDLIVAESQRRHGSSGESSPSDVVEQLPHILGDHSRGGWPGRLPALFAPGGDEPALAGRVEEVLPANRLGSLNELTGSELTSVLDRLSSLEHDISARRRTLHDVIDMLQEELVRRYRSGEATVDALLN